VKGRKQAFPAFRDRALQFGGKNARDYSTVRSSRYRRARETGISFSEEKEKRKKKEKIERAGCGGRREIKSRLFIMKRETTRYETRVSD
jgi:hypothetical protein